jgi:hypothetical protein
MRPASLDREAHTKAGLESFGPRADGVHCHKGEQ